MVAFFKLDLVLLLNIFYVYDCARRIKDGEQVKTHKRYMVYLVKASVSNKTYDAWVCGGAIVSKSFILTSAACVNDVKHIYAIAGYNKYVPDENIEVDRCTREKKKKIVHTCVPIKYELEYDKLEKWSLIDIALAQVESPYNFNDHSYETICTYMPETIRVNYEPRFQKAGLDGLVFGWGHTALWRKPEDKKNHNTEMLQYARIKIMDKQECKRHYEKFSGMTNVIDNYMICTLEEGDLDEKGEMIDKTDKTESKLNGCKDGLRLFSFDNELCDDDFTRRDIFRSNQTFINETMIKSKNKTLFNQTNESRKSGICQNDHGGPLITWVGASEIIIGVASVFKVSDDSKCMGPYLYTSTFCNGAFLDCLLSAESGVNRRSICDRPPIERGYDTVERNISWKDHPAGPAENELDDNVEQLLDDIVDKETTVSKNLRVIHLKFGKSSLNETIAIRPQRPINP